MSRRLFLLIAALTATLLMAACSPAEEVNGEDVAAEDSTEATETETPDDEGTETPDDDESASEDPSPEETTTDGASPGDTTEQPADSGSPADSDGGTDGQGTEDPASGSQDTDNSGDSGDDPADLPDRPFPPVPEGEADPCMLTEDQVESVLGQRLTMLGPSGSEAFRLCTYGEPADPGSIDLALVELAAASEEAGEDVTGEQYIDDLIEAAGDEAQVQEMDALGDGSAVRITQDEFGSEAWAYVGDRVYGVYSMGFDDNDANALELLEVIIDEAAS